MTFQQVFENLLKKLAKEERKLESEDRIWRVRFGKTQFWSCNLKNEFESLYFWKASFHFFGSWQRRSSRENFTFGSEFIRRWAYSIFIWYASGPGIPPKPSVFGRRRSIVLIMQSQDSATTGLQAAVRCCLTATLASETFWQHRQTFA